MDLYLINAATDAKRQTCFDMTEVSIWFLNKDERMAEMMFMVIFCYI